MQKIRKLLQLQRQQHVDDSTRTLFARMQGCKLNLGCLDVHFHYRVLLSRDFANHHASSSLSQLNAYEHDLKFDTHRPKHGIYVCYHNLTYLMCKVCSTETYVCLGRVGVIAS